MPQPICIHAANDIEPWRQRRLHILRRIPRRFPHTPHAILPFRIALGLVALEIVFADARMRIEIAIGRRLGVQPFKAQRQRDVLHHVRKVAGMKGVAVIQVTLRIGSRSYHLRPAVGARLMTAF